MLINNNNYCRARDHKNILKMFNYSYYNQPTDRQKKKNDKKRSRDANSFFISTLHTCFLHTKLIINTRLVDAGNRLIIAFLYKKRHRHRKTCIVFVYRKLGNDKYI